MAHRAPRLPFRPASPCRRDSPCRSRCTWPSSTRLWPRSGFPRWRSSTTTGTPPTSPMRPTCSVGSQVAPSRRARGPRRRRRRAAHGAHVRRGAGRRPGGAGLRSDDLWQTPWVADAFDADLRGRLLAALDAVPSFVDEIEAGPASTAHGDLPRTTCSRTSGSDDITLIDYGSAAALRRERPRPLLVGDTQIGHRAAATLPETDAACVPATWTVGAPRGDDRRRHGRSTPHALHLRSSPDCPHRSRTGRHRARTPASSPTPPRAGGSPVRLDLVDRREVARRPGLDSLHVSTLRESVERASLPPRPSSTACPVRAVPRRARPLVAGVLVPGRAWLLLALVVILLTWILLLAWPRPRCPSG